MKGDSDDVSPFMPLYWGDYWADTKDLECEEHGAYLQLIGALWNAGGHLPFDPRSLAKVISLRPARWAAVWQRLKRFFDVRPIPDEEFPRLSHKRVLFELEEARNRKRRYTDRANRGAEARWKNASSTPQAQPKHDASTAPSVLELCTPPSPSPSPSRDPETEVAPSRKPRHSESTPEVAPRPVGTGSEPAEPSLLDFPVDGNPERPMWGLTNSMLSMLRSGYPSLDVMAEARKALVWISTDPTRRKTAKGMPRFLAGWMARTQDRGGARQGSLPPPKPPAKGHPGLCDEHMSADRANKPARRHDPLCSECKHVAARRRQREGTPMAIGDIDELPGWAK